MLSPTLYENYIIDGNVVLPVNDHYREIRECTHTYDRYVYILYSDFFQLWLLVWDLLIYCVY